MLDTKYVYRYICMLGILMVVGYFGDKIKSAFTDKDEEYDMIRKFLLNDSPLYGYNRPKIWIHSKYEMNARKWKDFHSRNSSDLNQPYLHSAIKTIINHCADSFNICLIDDESFSKLIPNWDIRVSELAEPTKSYIRELGMLNLLYIYGGVIVPNSFICCRNLKDLYVEGTTGGRAFICESVNRSENMMNKKKMRFVPDMYFMGAIKNDPVIKESITYLQKRNMNPHYSSDYAFLGNTSEWFINMISQNKMNLVGGEMIGVKTKNRKTILLEDLMEEGYLNVISDIYGIYIPADEVLNRTKYQWLASISTTELLNSNLAVVKYLKASLVDTNSDYAKNATTEQKSIMSI